ncbi:hypothetical protein KIL84_013831 [Mauremys mutica]|uniref:Uncharacterized protein n=1 Tax=Mauremys mutica TaxID=74926 RepID=A0A9D3WY18_9SAUR|nr:hypothetical protein KIL84_013831 [Mauremys mutica]
MATAPDQEAVAHPRCQKSTEYLYQAYRILEEIRQSSFPFIPRCQGLVSKLSHTRWIRLCIAEAYKSFSVPVLENQSAFYKIHGNLMGQKRGTSMAEICGAAM